MILITPAMSNIVISIRSGMSWSPGSAIGRIRHSIATCARDCSRKIGAAIPRQRVISASADDRTAVAVKPSPHGRLAAWNGGLPFANPPYGLRATGYGLREAIDCFENKRLTKLSRERSWKVDIAFVNAVDQRVGRNSEAYSANSNVRVGAIRCAIAPYELRATSSGISWSPGSAIGLILHSIATCARACVRTIGAAIPRRRV